MSLSRVQFQSDYNLLNFYKAVLQNDKTLMSRVCQLLQTQDFLSSSESLCSLRSGHTELLLLRPVKFGALDEFFQPGEQGGGCLSKGTPVRCRPWTGLPPWPLRCTQKAIIPPRRWSTVNFKRRTFFRQIRAKLCFIIQALRNELDSLWSSLR